MENVPDPIVYSRATGPWAPLSIPDVAQVMVGASFPWWVGGGWALDLFVGRQTRAHNDVDVVVLRRDQASVSALFNGWDLWVAAGGQLRPWDGLSWLALGDNGLWCRKAAGDPWQVDLALTESDGEDWVFPRDPGIRLSLTQLGRRSPEGIPYIAPAVQLLIKAKNPRLKDYADFEMILPLLQETERRWLADTLAVTQINHAWLPLLLAPPR